MFFATLFWREPDLQIYNRAQWLYLQHGPHDVNCKPSICSFVSAKTSAVEKVDERRAVAHAEMKESYMSNTVESTLFVRME